MKKIVKIIYIIVISITIILSFNFVLNQFFLSKYNEKKYDENMLDVIKYINISQPCVVYYNIANAKYQTGDYDGAIEEYKKALKLFPTKHEDCDIRINLVLAMLKKIDVKNDKKEDILSVLYESLDILCEKGCANINDDNGHNKDAETLKEEILEFIDQLNKNGDSENDDDDKNKDENFNDKQNSNVEEQLKQIEKKSVEERKYKLNFSKEFNNYSYYDGKKW